MHEPVSQTVSFSYIKERYSTPHRCRRYRDLPNPTPKSIGQKSTHLIRTTFPKPPLVDATAYSQLRSFSYTTAYHGRMVSSFLTDHVYFMSNRFLRY